MTSSSFTVGVDVGGTFTDAVVVDASGKIFLGKDLSTHHNVSEGILKSVEDAAAKAGVSLPDLLRQTTVFLHSSTVAENMVVTRSGVQTGLITTKGFEDTLAMMRGGYGRWSGLTEDQMKDPVHTDKPGYLVRRSLIRGVSERIDYAGKEVVELDSREVGDAVEALVKGGAQSLGVCLLWSFANPAHEVAIREVIRQRYPNLYVTLSSEIVPVLGEYERTSSVAINSYLGPTISTYISSLEVKLKENGFKGTLLVMLSHGGLVRPAEAVQKSIGMIESGPVGGLVGSRFLGELLGLKNIIAADMGGTTFKVGIIHDGLIDYQREPSVTRYHYAFPKMDIVSIGAGGGSIAWLEPRTGIPKVGPNSAGSDPGPICYNFGGEEPTVTDVDLILGYLDPDFFLGGRIKLNRDKAVSIFKSKIADPMGLDVVDAAASIYEIANAQMYDLLHKVTVERGLDPSEYSMFVYGGAAGMHAASFGSEIKVTSIIVPNTASVHGAFGLVSSDVVHEFTATKTVRVPANPTEVNSILDRLYGGARAQLMSEGFDEGITLTGAVDMRFRRQVHVVTTPMEAAPPVDAAALESLGRRFENLYERRYGKGSAFTEAGTEIVAFRVRAIGSLGVLTPYRHPLGGRDPGAARVARKKVYFKAENGYTDADFYKFDQLQPGNEVVGPSIVLTPITTIVVNPRQRARVDEYKNILITPEGRSL